MKITEIITENKLIDKDNDGIPDSHQSATPGMRTFPKLQNSDPYHPWRFGAMFLGGAGDASGKYEHEPNRDGPNGQCLAAAAYSDGEKRILDQAAKAFGWEATYRQLTPDGSSEVDSVNKVSPMTPKGPVKRKK